MRTRDMSMADYGISAEEEKVLYKLCREMSAVDEDYSVLSLAAYSVNPDIAAKVLYSLTEGLSYDAISKETYIPIGRDDFYAYRRKTLAEFDKFRRKKNE